MATLTKMDDKEVKLEPSKADNDKRIFRRDKKWEQKLLVSLSENGEGNIGVPTLCKIPNSYREKIGDNTTEVESKT